jgi:sugar O-acyltransferase (sialic acid O-acetyltransferase NeuD family)
MNDIILIGASGLSREIIDAERPGSRIVGILDDDATRHGTAVGGVEVLGGTALAAEFDADLVLAIGAGAARRAVSRRLAALGVTEARFATIVDASVRVPASCAVGRGSVLLANVVLTSDVTVGNHVVVMPAVTLTHDDRIGDFVTIAAGVALGGSVAVADGAYVGMNASVRQGVAVGRDAVIGMGAAVLSDVPDGEVWAGVPARSLARRHAS